MRTLFSYYMIAFLIPRLITHWKDDGNENRKSLLISILPMLNSETADSQELGRGKIIGVIERLLFFFFVFTNNYGSIAFILVAKGFTRFRELDDKNFAEYVLIGTLLSSSLSIFWAYYIQSLVL